MEAGSWVECLFYLSGLHLFSAVHDWDQIPQYFFGLSYSFIPVDSFFIICPIYTSLLALETCRWSHFALQVVTQTWGATTKTGIDIETELIQQLFIEPYVPRILSNNSYPSEVYSLITGSDKKQINK